MVLAVPLGRVLIWFVQVPISVFDVIGASFLLQSMLPETLNVLIAA